MAVKLHDLGFRTAFYDPNGLLNTVPADIARWVLMPNSFDGHWQA